ncbi:MAG TPA: FHA domain-containing protein, partial [Nitrococcus sp.]|nr:FHA domain-containing protein [Nitrococcus sp.]
MKRSAFLVYNPGTPEEQEYSFTHRIVIGRRPEAEPDTQRVFVREPTVSGRHCIIRQSSRGRFFVQDVSRNGTRLSGRRLIPNVEVEIRPGDCLRIGDHAFVLAIGPPASTDDLPIEDDDCTRASSTHIDVTILVGDIRNYTVLNQEFDPIEFFPCLHRIFAELENV